jgi:multicomponent K+:H+ antiporter subunit D
MLHSTVVVAALFLLVELIASQRGDAGDKLQSGGRGARAGAAGPVVAAGRCLGRRLAAPARFLGKLMILESSHGLASQAWVWTVVLTVGFFTIIALARAGVVLFWHVQPDAEHASGASGSSPRLLAATGLLLVLGVAMTVFAAPLKAYTDATAHQLADKSAYTRAVLDVAVPPRPRPYRGELAAPVPPSIRSDHEKPRRFAQGRFPRLVSLIR